MPSKFKKAIAVVKDQTSIRLAKVGGNNSSSLEVAILKATTHDEGPIDERHVIEVLEHISSNKAYARACARAIGRRIGRTKNWVVAVKSLMLVLRIFQDGDLHFPKEVLHAMKRGYKILNLTSFRDESCTTCPWDFTAFVRTFALYLEERLDCFLTGKLQRRTSRQPQPDKTRGYPRKNAPIVRDMKPAILLDRITHWQKLLDRAIGSQPTGAAKTNKFVKICLYAIVQETFELYRDISDGLSILIDRFFHLPYNNCVTAFQTCVKASKQFKELSSFLDVCKAIGVGVISEYPTVQKISDELVETLREFLKDQSSFPSTPGVSTSDRDPSMSEYGGSQSMSLEELITADAGLSPDRYSDPGIENPLQCGEEDFFNENDTASVRSDPTDHRGVNSVLDLLSLDGPSPPPELYESGFDTSLAREQGWELVLFDTSNQPTPEPNNDNTSIMPTENNYSNPFLEDIIDDLNGETDLFASFPQTSFADEGGFPDDLGLVLGTGDFSSGFTTKTGVDFASDFAADFAAPTNANSYSHQSLPVDLFCGFSDNFGSTQNGATRDETADAMTEIVPFSQENKDDFFSSSATFQAAPTFRANSIDTDSGFGLENDPFGSLTAMTALEHQQQLWLQNQNSILARHLT